MRPEFFLKIYHTFLQAENVYSFGGKTSHATNILGQRLFELTQRKYDKTSKTIAQCQMNMIQTKYYFTSKRLLEISISFTFLILFNK